MCSLSKRLNLKIKQKRGTEIKKAVLCRLINFLKEKYPGELCEFSWHTDQRIFGLFYKLKMRVVHKDEDLALLYREVSRYQEEEEEERDEDFDHIYQKSEEKNENEDGEIYERIHRRRRRR